MCLSERVIMAGKVVVLPHRKTKDAFPFGDGGFVTYYIAQEMYLHRPPFSPARVGVRWGNVVLSSIWAGASNGRFNLACGHIYTFYLVFLTSNTLDNLLLRGRQATSPRDPSPEFPMLWDDLQRQPLALPWGPLTPYPWHQ